MKCQSVRREEKNSVMDNSGRGLQWGSEIRTSLEFEWSKRGWVSNVPDFEWDLKSGSSTI